MSIVRRTIEGGSNNPENRVVTACIVNKAVLGQIAAMWTRDALPSPWANLVVGWAVAYYREWRRAPGADIQTEYDAWRVGAADPATVEAVGRFLAQLSENYRRTKEGVQVDYTLKLAQELMLRVRILTTAQHAQAHLEANDLDKAAAELTKFRPPVLGTNAWIDTKDTEKLAATIAAARERRSAPLITYPGALGNFFGRALERDSFIAFLGPKKGSKSFVLQDMAWRAHEQGRKVAFFEAGDLSRDQVLDRFIVRSAGRPIDGDPIHPYPFPTSIEPPRGLGIPGTLEHSHHWFKDPMTIDEQVKALSGLSVSGTGSFRISAHPARTLSVPGIESQLERWAQDDWSPDCVFCDYPDIMLPPEKGLQGLDAINETWIALRGLSQKQGCLVVAATQARRESHHKYLMDQTDVADETRKLAHVTGMVGINRLAAEIPMGIWRLNWVAVRGLALSAHEQVHVAGSLAVGNPCMVSTF